MIKFYHHLKHYITSNAINVTLGLPYIRVSPDHGTGEDIIKNLANPESLVQCIKFFSKING